MTAVLPRGVEHPGRRTPSGAGFRVWGAAALAVTGAVPAAVRWPLPVALGAATVGVVVLVATQPQWSAYLYLAVAPLVLGIDRGAALPFLRPHELLLGVLWLGVLAGPGFRWLASGARMPRVAGMDVAVVAVAVASSLVPLGWAYAQSRPVGQDDVLYALALWKLSAVYLLVRVSLRRADQVRRAVGVVLAVGGVLAVAGVAQVLDLFGAASLLQIYAPADAAERLASNRASATIGTPIGFADVMVMTLGLAVGWLVHLRVHRLAVGVVAALTSVAAVASGQVTGVLGLLVAAVAAGWAVGRLARTALVTGSVALAAGLAVWPVVAQRIERLDPRTGLPVSWTGPSGRWANLTTHVWPRLAEDGNWLFGVQVSGRIPAPEPWRQWIYIESGYTWLLWNGGLPLLAAFVVLVALGFRAAVSLARGGVGVEAVVGVGTLTALSVLIVLMVTDPHLSMRGAADLFFPLLAMTAGRHAARRPREVRT